MYNLIVTAQEGAWTQPTYLCPIDRFAEKTDLPIREKYKTFSEEAIEELKSFPTLFVYEDFVKGDARVGYITHITIRYTSIYIEFRIFPDILPIPHSTLSTLAQKLDITGYWALSRTYWAIKDENLLDVLLGEGLITPHQYSTAISNKIADLELENIEKRAALHKAERLAYLGGMATMMAHNINQPIAVIRMAASGALSDVDENLFNPSTELKPLLEKILNQTERLSQIMGNFRKFARGDRTVLAPVNLNTVIEDIYQLLFVAQYQLDNIECQKIFSTSPIAYANELALQEMLISLLSNARAAIKDKTNKQVTIKTWQQDNQVGFSVEDNGEGITQENLPKLFTPFLSSKHEGMGLGLYFCREIAKDLGGSIEYYPAPLGGAGFKITLPAAG
ncbi:putative Histidine kinase [Crenothrix polyspora]|uniref:histidine kinase n=1 Tax=Crenothrix polyspora TaxID=360316 RepID=A0A1R4HAV2_9GAMM|nr:ATP-binding protein [Crenothrix polyspora]SJM93161.1 putative Histidine kinase [Crenothrix polyspora]